MSLIQEHLHIGGMTCVNCQNKIEAELRELKGIKKCLISRQQIEQKIEALDYEVLPEDQAGQPDISRMISFLAIMIALYVLFNGLAS